MTEESKTWYRMTRPLFNSGFEDDEFLAYGQDGFAELLDSVIGENVEIYEKRIGGEPVRTRAIVQNTTSDVHSGASVRQILCEIGHLRCGQYIKIKGAYWLVSAFPDNNGLYEKAVLWKCKHTLRFISPLTGEVVEYPVYNVNSTQYGTGESRREHITVGDAQHLIYIPYNEETILIDDQFRFIMDRNRVRPTVYRVTQVDTTSYAVGSENEDGLLQWSVLQTQFNPRTDSAELMIADYYADVREPEMPGDPGAGYESGLSLSLIPEGGDWAITIGESRLVTVRCFDADGNEVTGLTFDVAVKDPYGAVSYERDGSEIVFYAKDDVDLIGCEVEVEVSADHAYSGAANLTVIGW